MIESAKYGNELSALQVRIREQDLELLRQRDQIIGLEAEIDQLAEGRLADALRNEISEIKSSASYRIGRVITAPARFFRKVFNFLRRKAAAAFRHTRSRVNTR